MMNDERKSFVEFMCVFMRMRVVVPAVGDEDTSQNIKKVVNKKGDTRMNSVSHIVIVTVMGDE
jgi:hypothetical protein